MVYSETIKLKMKSQSFSNITNQVEEIVRKSEVEDGICTVFSKGSTSAVLINEDEPMLLQDLKNSLEKIASEREIYQHTENAYSHIRSAFVGNSQSVPVKEGKLLLGTWQEIMVANFDVNNREREIIVTVIGE
jgi:secondary thiamine-phosphate synthase enzyme